MSRLEVRQAGPEDVDAVTDVLSEAARWLNARGHALAVRRAFAGHRLGERLLEWAGERVTEAGRDFLRLDCRADNPVLQAYYERLGFERQGEVDVDDCTCVLYERRLRED